ncbi:YraN family protein [Aestuariirhabdus litorea]|uniref:UPF0102 protein D0544_09950 n=1 Tax=Aestuariirhabdus litorea TaxID=2528527 RepID=A0A3P3VSD2_9GAMM|nr:YraN family protein [Aestuariirhabdus litorea]RRJ85354.1 YraN family protein [Aestuariirhabdus litorea]RWW98578.1 YraN family protein [Endozoicomonadaceae bacterium GTF-13]
MRWILKQKFNRGQLAENQALSFLQRQGLHLLTRNYAWRGGELDLVMETEGTIVFVEVRQRTSACYGTAQESLSSHKRQRLIQCAQHYLQTQQLCHKPCRFDVLAANGKPRSGQFDFDWIQNAITL